jgi:cell division protein FtsZ
MTPLLFCFLILLYHPLLISSLIPSGKRFFQKSSLLQLQAQPGGYQQTPTGIGMGSPCKIKVIGVGGGGGNAVNRIVGSNEVVDGVEMWAVNTDTQALKRNAASNKLIIGKVVSKGLGAGGNPSIGAKAADESRDDIRSMVGGSDMVFVTAGMGGGTGSGAAPIVAECAKESGALTVGVVTKPFGFEGRKRMQQARAAILELRNHVDTLIVVSNDKLLEIVPENTPLQDAFSVADDILRQGVVGISEIIIKPGLVNVDFADVRTIMGNGGTALMGIGKGKGKNRAKEAAMAAISSPLLEFPITKATGIMFNVVGGQDMSIQEINAAADIIYENVDSDANIIFGAMVDDNAKEGEVTITVLATGFSTDFFDQSTFSEQRRATIANSSAGKAAGAGRGQNPLIRQKLNKIGNSMVSAKEYLPMGASSHLVSLEERDRDRDRAREVGRDDDNLDFVHRRTEERGRGSAKAKVGGVFRFLKRLLFG